MADRGRDPDSDRTPEGTAAYREVERGRLWADLRDHGYPILTEAAQAAADLAFAKERLADALASNNPISPWVQAMLKVDHRGRPLPRPLAGWQLEDSEIEDSDNRFAGLNSSGLDLFGRDGWE